MSTGHMDAENSRELVVADPDGVSYRVRAVKKGMWLRGDLELGGGGSLVDFAVTFVLDVLIGLFVSARAASQTAWKVGVFRQGRASQRLVHKELLSPA